QRALAPQAGLVLAVKADGDAGLLEPILERFAADPAAVPVTVRLCALHESATLLRRGEADVALVHGPYDPTGLDSEPLTVEPRVAAVAAAHPLAARTRLSLDDLGMTAEDVGRPVGRPRDDCRDLAQLLTLVALGEVVTLLPASVTLRYPRPGVAYRPVVDAPAAVMAVAWPQQSRST
ncbi:LysR family transcriptional regulator, partial [Streptomyces sp. SID625]|nr:LysR family transcriptional regulator [Streptomyces sp. SID625]